MFRPTCVDFLAVHVRRRLLALVRHRASVRYTIAEGSGRGKAGCLACLRLIDGSFPCSKWKEGIAGVAARMANRPARSTTGIPLLPLEVTSEAEGRVWVGRHTELRVDVERRVAEPTGYDWRRT